MFWFDNGSSGSLGVSWLLNYFSINYSIKISSCWSHFTDTDIPRLFYILPLPKMSRHEGDFVYNTALSLLACSIFHFLMLFFQVHHKLLCYLLLQALNNSKVGQIYFILFSFIFTCFSTSWLKYSLFTADLGMSSFILRTSSLTWTGKP